MIYLLDTDHVSLDQRGHSVVSARISMAGPSQVTISLISVEEQLRGWLAVLRAAKNGDTRCAAYGRLRAAVEYFASTTLIDYDRAADNLFESLRRQGIRIGTQDLRIAAIALTHNAIVLTRNTRDFGLVPGLSIEDWSLPAS
jgi:tRNA(fMet)-specific endonuclease VapC